MYPILQGTVASRISWSISLDCSYGYMSRSEASEKSPTSRVVFSYIGAKVCARTGTLHQPGRLPSGMLFTIVNTARMANSLISRLGATQAASLHVASIGVRIKWGKSQRISPAFPVSPTYNSRTKSLWGCVTTRYGSSYRSS